ncbi:hypothetical protein [Rhizobium leguminosarum]|uniref:hypothetical protein n=1 Tax=Rhizobium leguminosarum TaxID=384 RepID=UPI001F171F2A|nr:hypothetical protein [Rhizobium leguminosarum]UIK20673.1 hypothetical protein LZK79_27720 [Rhizobium leguminosarum]
MHIENEEHGEMSCQIDANEEMDHYVGTLRYRIFEVGLISGPSVGAVRAQFRAICEMTDAGGMVRNGIIMTGYHNRAFSGDVLRVDGEIIGEWTSDDEEWCHFTAVDTVEVTLSAPSPWMLHDSIATWMNCDGDTTKAYQTSA